MYKEAFKLIEESKKIVLISHLNPDGDALGSSLAMFFALKNMGKKVKVVNVSKKLPQNLDFLPGFNEIKKDLPKNYDLMISFDCGSFDRLGIGEKKSKLINFDHHITNTNYGDINIVEPKFAATGEVIFKFLKENSLNISKDIATCLYTALVSDTGFFQFESVNERVFLVASELVRLGARPDFISKMLNERESLCKVRLLAKALGTLTLYLDAKVGLIEVTQKMLKESGADITHTEDMANIPRNLATVEVGVMLREEESGEIKVSLRSKNYVDVSKIAAKFGGGGHKRAAGFTSKERDFKKVLDDLLRVIKEEL